MQGFLDPYLMFSPVSLHKVAMSLQATTVVLGIKMETFIYLKFKLIVGHHGWTGSNLTLPALDLLRFLKANIQWTNL